jgi:hypothetical protein
MRVLRTLKSTSLKPTTSPDSLSKVEATCVYFGTNITPNLLRVLAKEKMKSKGMISTI